MSVQCTQLLETVHTRTRTHAHTGTCSRCMCVRVCYSGSGLCVRPLHKIHTVVMVSVFRPSPCSRIIAAVYAPPSPSSCCGGSAKSSSPRRNIITFFSDEVKNPTSAALLYTTAVPSAALEIRENRFCSVRL